MTTFFQARRALWWWLIPLLLLTTWLGARGLDADIVWVDEYHSMEDAGISYFGPLTPAGIWNRVATGNPWHAPGYFFALNAWHRLVGPTPPALRAMSLLFGLLTIAWTYRLGKELVGPRAGLFAAVILGTSAFYAHFLHEMRVYTLFTFLTVFTIWVYLRIVRSPRAPGWPWWLAFFGGALALLYIHYFAMLPLAAISLYHLLFVRKDRRWWLVVATLALAAVLFLPWVRVLIELFGRTEDFDSLSSRALSVGDALTALAHYFSNGNVVLLFALLVPALLVRGRGARTILFLAFALLVLLFVVNAILKVMHGGRLRYPIALWPLFSLVIALGLLKLQRWRPLPLVLLAVWVGFGLYNTVVVDITSGLDGGRYIFPMHLIVRQVEGKLQPDDVIVNYLPDTGLPALQYERIGSFYYTPIDLEYLLVQSPPDDADWPAKQAAFLELLGPRPRVWLASMPGNPPSTLDAFTDELLATHIRCEPSYSRAGLLLDLYAASPDLCQS